MAISVRTNDKLPSFKRSAYSVLDDALREGARDTLIGGKQRAPFDKGMLRSHSDAKQRKPLSWRVSFWEEYARFQHEGGDSKRRIRNYNTAGTGEHYLKDAGDAQANRINKVFKKHAGRARA